jgi:uncharacterized protein YmfQ (DUF2313 family)
MKIKNTVLTIAIGGLLVSVPATIPVASAADNVRSTSDPNLYSDRDRIRASKDDEDALEKALKVGQEKAFYRKQLEKMGWRITAVNYDQPDYLEYEIVKGKDTFEVQIDFDKSTRKATEVDVAMNAWQADATDRALKGQKVAAYPNKTTANPDRFSDRDRMKSAKDDEDKLEQALKTGQDKNFYRSQLEKMGWKITSVNYDQPDYVEYEVVKGDDSFEIQIDFDKSSRKATKIDVAANAWKTDATKKALDQRQSQRR